MKETTDTLFWMEGRPHCIKMHKTNAIQTYSCNTRIQILMHTSLKEGSYFKWNGPTYFCLTYRCHCYKFHFLTLVYLNNWNPKVVCDQWCKLRFPAAWPARWCCPFALSTNSLTVDKASATYALLNLQYFTLRQEREETDTHETVHRNTNQIRQLNTDSTPDGDKS